MRITRTTNPNGSYRYDVDGDVHINASKVLYTHATIYSVNDASPVLFHKTENAAQRAKGYPKLGWVKTATLAIEDDTVSRRCGWCGDPLAAGQRKFCSRSCTVRQQNRSRARQR